MRIYDTPRIPVDQIGALLVGILAMVGLVTLGNLATTTLPRAALLLAGIGLTAGVGLMVWYWYSVIANLLWHYKCRRLEREERERGER